MDLSAAHRAKTVAPTPVKVLFFQCQKRVSCSNDKCPLLCNPHYIRQMDSYSPRRWMARQKEPFKPASNFMSKHTAPNIFTSTYLFYRQLTYGYVSVMSEKTPSYGKIEMADPFRARSLVLLTGWPV